MDDDYEQTLLVVKECFVYRIPPRKAASGYKAGEWDTTNPIWTGRLVVTSKGANAQIKLEDPNTGEAFAMCPVDDTAVEGVNDSSRFFVLKIVDAGRHAFIGLGFQERSDAFDFNSALQDHKRYVRQAKESEEASKRLESTPAKDYSLPEGSKIHVSIKTKKSGTTPTKPKNEGGLSFGSGGLLPPPPSAKSAPQQSKPQSATTVNDIWSDFTSFSGSQQQPQQQQQQQQPSNQFDWANF